MAAPVLGLVGSAAGGLEELLPKLIEPMQERGWRVAMTLTPNAATWLDASGDLAKIEHSTGLPVRHQPRLPTEVSPHPPIDCYAVVPASANSIAKLALGIADNQALTTICETLGFGEVPIVAFPRINSAHANQPSWDEHIGKLERAGVHLVMGEDVWPLHRPRSAPGRELPWSVIIDKIISAAQRAG